MLRLQAMVVEMSDVNKVADWVQDEFESAENSRFADSLIKTSGDFSSEPTNDNSPLDFSEWKKFSRIVKDAARLAELASAEAGRARKWERIVGCEFVRQPAWHMLLELFQNFYKGVPASTKSLQLVSGCPETTSLRILERLEAAGLVERKGCEADKRRTLVRLTCRGVLQVGSALETLGA